MGRYQGTSYLRLEHPLFVMRVSKIVGIVNIFHIDDILSNIIIHYSVQDISVKLRDRNGKVGEGFIVCASISTNE